MTSARDSSTAQASVTPLEAARASSAISRRGDSWAAAGAASRGREAKTAEELVRRGGETHGDIEETETGKEIRRGAGFR